MKSYIDFDKPIMFEMRPAPIRINRSKVPQLSGLIPKESRQKAKKRRKGK